MEEAGEQFTPPAPCSKSERRDPPTPDASRVKRAKNSRFTLMLTRFDLDVLREINKLQKFFVTTTFCRVAIFKTQGAVSASVTRVANKTHSSSTKITPTLTNKNGKKRKRNRPTRVKTNRRRNSTNLGQNTMNEPLNVSFSSNVSMQNLNKNNRFKRKNCSVGHVT